LSTNKALRVDNINVIGIPELIPRKKITKKFFLLFEIIDKFVQILY
jgi:hypothetical protein